MKKCLIVMGYMMYGGVQNSLINFIENLKDKADIDVLLWGRLKDELPLPSGVNILNVPTVKSVRGALKENGLFSKSFFLSLIGAFLKKRWKAMPKIKKHYDFAIAYTQAGYPKYFVIDRVSADKKYAFYHHGAYSFSGKIKQWDKEYYPKYDKLFCVSQSALDVVKQTLSVDIKYDLMPNFLNYKQISLKGQAPCEEWENSSSLKILTVARLSPEKNLFKCIEVAYNLKKMSVDFIWYIIGSGNLYNDLKIAIENKGLTSNLFLIGDQKNPYRFMRTCNVYAQFSEFEADSVTVKENAVFNNYMVLSNISAFQVPKKIFNNIVLTNTVNDAVLAIKEYNEIKIIENNLTDINNVFYEKLNNLIK